MRKVKLCQTDVLAAGGGGSSCVGRRCNPFSDFLCSVTGRTEANNRSVDWSKMDEPAEKLT